MGQLAHACGAQCIPAAVVFAQGQSTCARDARKAYTKARWQTGSLRQKCNQRMVAFASAIAAAGPHALTPRGFVEFEPGMVGAIDTQSFTRTSSCWKRELADGLGLGLGLANTFVHAVPTINYVRGATFAVARTNILTASEVVLAVAHATLGASRELPWVTKKDIAYIANGESLAHEARCCNRRLNHTCLPWVLERSWDVHR